MGVSRKSWLSHLLGTERDSLAELDAYTALASTVMPFPAVAVHRVHNVGLLQRAFKLTRAMRPC
jgi:dihydropteroate synthase